MPDLVPYPFDALCRRAFRELDQQEAIFDLPRSKWVLGSADRDLSVSVHGRRAASPLGPAAGPHTQMAQNLVLSWLGGSRVFELKTVQILDQLEIPRPCIDMHTYGLNVEWSQELRLEQSLQEYVKGAMLIEMLQAERVRPAAGFSDLVWDLSVGYDLEGIRSERVAAFLDGMRDAAAEVERLRRQIPAELRGLRDLEFRTRLSDTVTLSTFHGCPPEEIERIIEHLMRAHQLHATIKFNPTLLGSQQVHELLHERLGYHQLTVPATAFERDTKWQQAVEMIERLAGVAAELGLGLGAKFSNTLIVRNDRGFLAPSEEEAYLSGPPLHVLAMHLVRRFRRTFGDRFPISFAAGIDRQNFPDAVALGLVPITVCSDLLQKGGYGRLAFYDRELAKRMDEVGARTVGEFTIKAYGQGDVALERLGLEPEDTRLAACRAALANGGDLEGAAGAELFARWVSAARLLDTEVYVDRLDEDQRYAASSNTKGPKKIGRHLQLFDCLTCDLCIPVCPNDANFTLAIEPTELPVAVARRREGEWQVEHRGALALTERHQIANFADFCNDCGNCDIFCPEDGGPYRVKPRFFGSEEAWRSASDLDGFYVERLEEGDRVLGRLDGKERELRVEDRSWRFSGDGFAVRFRAAELEALDGVAEDGAEIDLTPAFIMDRLRCAVLDVAAPNYINAKVAGA